MRIDDLRAAIALGEDSTRQFKVDVKNSDSLASEMAAFANSEARAIYLGVGNDGSTPGLTREDVARINQIISNAASQHVRSPLTVQTENVGLSDNLTVERIRAGISNIRNPILVSFAAKGLLPYHGLGSGIKRALENWPDIDFTDDREGCLFIATVHRKELVGAVGRTGLPKTSGKTSGKILNAICQNDKITIPELALTIGVTARSIERNIQQLQSDGRLRRVGPAKGGHWEVIEK